MPKVSGICFAPRSTGHGRRCVEIRSQAFGTARSRINTSRRGSCLWPHGTIYRLPCPTPTPRLASYTRSMAARIGHRPATSASFPHAPKPIPNKSHQPSGFSGSNISPPACQHRKSDAEAHWQHGESPEPSVQARQCAKRYSPLEVEGQDEKVLQPFEFDSTRFVWQIARVRVVDVERTRALPGQLQLQQGRYRHRR